jgi:transposase
MVSVNKTKPIDIRTRLAVIEKYKSKMKPKMISKELNISLSSVYLFINRFKKDESIEYKTPSRKGIHNPNAKITDKFNEMIDKVIEKNCFQTSYEDFKEKSLYKKEKNLPL